jgi:uncharacterized membrane protein (Fun14 family)
MVSNYCHNTYPLRVAGYAIKKVMKIAAVIVGLFVVGLAFLAYKGWIDIKLAQWRMALGQHWQM